jgi:hypothetical protein
MRDVSDVPLKRCPSCPEPEENRWHPATPEYFSRDKQKKDGLRPQCKACQSKKDKEYRDSPEGKAHIQAHLSRPEVQKYRNDQRMIYIHHPSRWERLKAHKKEYDAGYEARPEVIAHKQEYDNRPDVRERERAYMQVYFKVYGKTYYSRLGVQERCRVRDHSRRARKKAVLGTHTAAQVQEQLKRQHYRCYYAACGFSKFPRIRKNGQWKYAYHVEHTFPLSRVAGTDIPANDMGYLVLSCKACNRRKGKRFPWEWPEGGRLL